MNRIKSAIILAIALTAIAAMAAAQNIVQNSVHNMSVSAHANTKTDIKLAPRSPLVPYHSREAALEGDPNASQWSIGLADWKREAAAEYTRYSARVKIPRTWDGRAVILRTEGVTASFEVAMNGKAAGYSNSGMAYAEFDLTEYARQDYNDISVTIYSNTAALEVENHRSHDNPVIGSAALISQPLVRIRDFAVETSVERGTGWLSLAIMTQSHLRNPKDCVVSYELISPDGKVVAQSSRELTTKWMSADTLRFAVSVPDVKRWNHETPHIYTIVAKIFREGRFTEYIPAKIGFRSVSHGNGCLLIDGVKVPVYNIVFGWQGDYASTEAGLHSLKGRGFNCVTVPGYPQPDCL